MHGLPADVKWRDVEDLDVIWVVDDEDMSCGVSVVIFHNEVDVFQHILNSNGCWFSPEPRQVWIVLVKVGVGSGNQQRIQFD